MIREIIKADHLPDYTLIEEPGDLIHIRPRAAVIEATDAPLLSQDALEEARQMIPGVDVYALEAQWRGFWVSSGRPRLGSADKAFLGWVKTHKKGD